MRQRKTDFPVPTSEVEITLEWLEAALPSDIDIESTSLERTRIGETYGFASRIFRYSWQSDKPSQSVVVKLWDTQGKAGTEEVHFYQTFCDLGVRTPECFYAAADGQSHRAVLVLEDLSRAAQGDCLELLDLPRAKRVAQSLAKLHATWLNRETELTWLPNISLWTREADWFCSRRTLFLERFPNHLSGLSRSLLERLEHAPSVVNECLEKAPSTLLHGDFHLDNLMFDSEEPVFLDWSRPVRGPAALNLAELLFAMTSLRNFDSVLEHYLGTFAETSERPPERTVLEQQLGGALLRKFATKTCGIALWQPSTPREARLIESGIQRAGDAVTFWHGRDLALFSSFH